MKYINKFSIFTTAALFTSLLLLVYTPIGIKFIARLINSNTEYTFHIEAVEGKLAGISKFSNITIMHPDYDISIKNLTLNLHLSKLIHRTIAIKSIQAETINIHSHAKQSHTSLENFEDINVSYHSPFFHINVDKLIFNNIAVWKNKEIYKIDNLNTNFILNKGGIAIPQLTITGPQINAKLSATLNPNEYYRSFIKANYKINTTTQTIQGDGNVSFTLQPPYNLSAHFDTQSDSINPVNNFKFILEGSGTEQQHKISVNLDTKQATVNLNITGEFKKNAWHGNLEKLNLNEKQTGKWNLQKASHITMNTKTLVFEQFCLENNGTNICTELGVKKPKRKIPNVHLLSKLQLNNLALLNNMIPDISQAQGKLNARFEANGKVIAPKIFLNLNFNLDKAKILDLNTYIRNLILHIDASNPEEYSINGEGTLGDGKFIINGTSKPSHTKAPVEINLTGDSLLISDTSEIKLLASPKLLLSLNQNQLNISGSINIPKARIAINKKTHSIQTTDDIVFVNKSIKKQNNSYLIKSNLDIILGKDVKLNSKGLNTNLSGKFNISSAQSLIPRVSGNINLKNGTYTVFGKNLDLEKGMLYYHNSNLDNPFLDIKAVRNIQSLDDNAPQSIVIGALLTGTLRAPNLQLFSEPSMNEADILSYYLFGKKRASTSETESALFTAASLKLWQAIGGDNSSGSLQDILGLDELSLETIQSSSTEEDNLFALNLGKQINSNLYVQYSVGLADALRNLRIKYKINKYLQLEAATGLSGSSADVIYSIEK